MTGARAATLSVVGDGDGVWKIGDGDEPPPTPSARDVTPARTGAGGRGVAGEASTTVTRKLIGTLPCNGLLTTVPRPLASTIITHEYVAAENFAGM